MFRLRAENLICTLLIGVTIQACTTPKTAEETTASDAAQTASEEKSIDDPHFRSERTAELLAVPVDIDTDLTKVITSDHPAMARKVPRKIQNTRTPADGTLGANDGDQAQTDPAALQSPGAAPPSLNARGKKNYGSNGTITYVVKSNDTLMKIAFEIFGNLYRWREIYDENKAKIGNFNSLVKGTVLTVRLSNVVNVTHTGDPYLIQRRDTLIKISNKLYGTPKRWWHLWDNNREMIHDPNRIYAGFTLYYRLFNTAAKELASRVQEEEPVADAEAPRSPAAAPEESAADASPISTAPSKL